MGERQLRAQDMEFLRRVTDGLPKPLPLQPLTFGGSAFIPGRGTPDEERKVIEDTIAKMRRDRIAPLRDDPGELGEPFL